MNQTPRYGKTGGPRLGRTLVSLAVSLTALVALGLGIYWWNSGPVSEQASRTDAGRADDVSNRAVAASRGDLPSETFAAESSVDGSGTGTVLTGRDGGGREGGAGIAPGEHAVTRPAGATGGDALTGEGSLPGERESFEEDLTDVERPVTYAQAEGLYRSGDYEGAARHFAAYLEDHKENAWGRYMLGLSRWKAGRPEAAEEALLSALDLEADHVPSLVNLARVRLDLGRPAEALVPSERALQIEPNGGAVLRVHARVLHNLGREEEAASTYLASLAVDHDDVWSMNNLGLIRIEQEEFTDAVPPLALAARLDTTEAVFLNNLGIALERIGDFRGAVRAYERAVAMNPDHIRAAASRDRALALVPSQSREPLDLASQAEAFARSVEASHAALGIEPTPELSEAGHARGPETAPELSEANPKQ